MFKKLIILFFFLASVYFAYGTYTGWQEIQAQRLIAIENLYYDHQDIEKRIEEIESRRDALEKTMVEYMRDMDRKIKKIGG